MDTIAFEEVSIIGRHCPCRGGGDFTYFQTSFDVPAATTVSTFVVNIGRVDDGVRVTVFNGMHPAGYSDPGGYVFGSGGRTTDLARYIVPGRNRVVLTHVDDCGSGRVMRNVTVNLNGAPLTRCAR